MNKIDKMFAWFNSPITTASMIGVISVSGYVVIMGVLGALIIFGEVPVYTENQQMIETRSLQEKNAKNIEILSTEIDALINDLRVNEQK